MAWFKDTFANLVSGLGLFGVDKAAHGTFTFGELTQMELENAYRGEWIARKIVDIPAFDMTRAWRFWDAEKSEIEKLEAEEKRLQVRAKVHKAIWWGRLYGGGAIIMDDGRLLSQPLTTSARTGTQGGLRSLITVNRFRLRGGDTQYDPTLPGFDEPKVYRLTSTQRGSLDVHPSRVVAFPGNPYPNPDLLPQERSWGDSVLQSVKDAVLNAARANTAIASMLEEALVDVIKMPDMMSQVTTKEYRDRVEARWELAMVVKGINKALLIDGNEEYERKQTNFANLPQVLEAFMQVVAGAADIPAARFLSQSPSGLNATGEVDLRNYYDMISAKQGVELDPRMQKLDDALVVSALGSPNDRITSEWRKLWGLNPTDAADAELKRAQAASAYALSGLIPSAALAKGVQAKLIEDGTYPGLEEAIEEAEAGTLLPFEDPAVQAEHEQAIEMVQETAKAKAAAAPRKAANDHRLALADATPRTLYVRRQLLNGRQFIAWARAQGFTNPMPADHLHVTVAYSRAPVDWMKVGSDWYSNADGGINVPAGGPRIVEPLGGKGAVVLLFRSEWLESRHASILTAGADWPEAFDGYQPHVTISWDASGMDLSKVTPYPGPLLFGPEIFEQVNENWRASLTEGA